MIDAKGPVRGVDLETANRIRVGGIAAFRIGRGQHADIAVYGDVGVRDDVRPSVGRCVAAAILQGIGNDRHIAGDIHMAGIGVHQHNRSAATPGVKEP